MNGSSLGILIRLFALLLVGGCTVKTERAGIESPKVQTVWPLPPDVPRLVYEAVLRRPSDIEAPRGDTLYKKLTSAAVDDDQPAFQKPGALAVANGRLYVADTVGRQIVVFDFPRRKLFKFGYRSPGRIVKPSALALDGDSNVYIADTSLRQVLVYDALGLYLKSIGGPKDLERPSGVAVNKSGSLIYIVDRSKNDSDGHRIVIYDGEGNKQGQLGTRGRAPGQFNVPTAAAMGPGDTLHVLDAGNFRVQVFDSSGRFLRSFGDIGAGMGNFSRPRGLAIDAVGNVLVTDAAFGNFQMFNADGELLLPVGQISRVDVPGRFALISGIAADEGGRIYVSDQYFNKVEVFRRLGGDMVGQAPSVPKEIQ